MLTQFEDRHQEFRITLWDFVYDQLELTPFNSSYIDLIGNQEDQIYANTDVTAYYHGLPQPMVATFAGLANIAENACRIVTIYKPKTRYAAIDCSLYHPKTKTYTTKQDLHHILAGDTGQLARLCDSIVHAATHWN